MKEVGTLFFFFFWFLFLLQNLPTDTMKHMNSVAAFIDQKYQGGLASAFAFCESTKPISKVRHQQQKKKKKEKKKRKGISQSWGKSNNVQQT
jgi:hypothetical protein